MYEYQDKKNTFVVGDLFTMNWVETCFEVTQNGVDAVENVALYLPLYN